MGRLFVYLAIMAAGLVVAISLLGSDQQPGATAARELLPEAVPLTVWIIGILMGLALAWTARFDWRSLPVQVATWFRLMRRRLWWMLWGGLCAGVLLFF